MNTRRFLFFIFYFSLLSWLFVSCTKTSHVSSTLTFTKVVAQDSDFNTVNSFQLSDGNYMLLGVDPKKVRLGLMVKLSATGTILWQKRLPVNLLNICKAMPLPGSGFVAAGFPTYNSGNCLQIFQFDNDGNTVLTKLDTMAPFSYSYANFEMIQLNNGNFAFANSLEAPGGYFNPFLMITDNAFNILSKTTYHDSKIPAKVNYGALCLCESTDGTINMAGYYSNTISSLAPDNTFLLRTTNNGVQKSFTLLSDSAVNETPNCIISDNDNKTHIISSKAINGNGIFVYYDFPFWSYISGTIGIDNFDTSGIFETWQLCSGYSNNGLIQSARATQDGGYILCGIVNQLNNGFIVSPTEIYVMKLDASLNQQWSNTYDTFYPSYGVDACQTTDGGYLISGYHRSFNNHFDMVLIKTDANGNVN
jgi:hypothetical protein